MFIDIICNVLQLLLKLPTTLFDDVRIDAAKIGSTRQSLQLVFIGGVLAWTLALAVKTSRAR